MTGRVAALALLLAATAPFAACGRNEEPEEEPLPALSRAGSRWQVTRGDRVIFNMTNGPGPIRWASGGQEHPFIGGEIADPKEETRLRDILRRSRHFRDLVRRLERAGYGVAASESPPAKAPPKP